MSFLSFKITSLLAIGGGGGKLMGGANEGGYK